jgi:hypothetical protein
MPIALRARGEPVYFADPGTEYSNIKVFCLGNGPWISARRIITMKVLVFMHN